ncbi:putative DEAD-box ATP-dependent RNA helicase [archaeon BMS3Abin16]|nr:putative DEAD-box ATP-dependent RNA helicase [archaeon BMS3Abin16]
MFVSHPLVKKDKIESRAYQEAIAESAVSKNTLVVAPTALGKTVIAVLVAAHFLERFPGRQVVVLAPTRPLAAQHAASFREFLNISESRVVLLTGDVSPDKRVVLWKGARVVCATPQVIRNDFAHGRYSADDLSLAVFDEAHRAVGEYPYPELAEEMECRILALTASPGGNVESIDLVCKNLRIKSVEIRDEKDADTAPYVKGTFVEYKRVVLPEPYWVIRNILVNLLRDRLRVLKLNGAIESARSDVTKKELLDLMKALQKGARSGGTEFYASISAVSAALTIAHAIDLLETQGMGPLSKYLERTAEKAKKPKASKALRGLSVKNDFKRALAMSITLREKYSDPKKEALREIIQSIKRDTKIIVFTQYRDTAREIAGFLSGFEGVRAVRFVGQASKAGDPGLSQKKQLEVLQSFREGEFNVLVATSVAEEGLDIPSVDLVVFFEPVPSEIRMIQRRGRTGRRSVGLVVVLIAEKTRDEGFYWSSVARERRMKKSLRGIRDRGEGRAPDLTRWTEGS